MTIIKNLNKLCAGGNGVPWWIKETLKAAGWTMPMCGTGSGGVYYNDGTDPFVGFNRGSLAGPTDLGRANCWYVLEAPNGRQFLFLRSPTGTDIWDANWSNHYSPGGLYTGGSASVIPTASDQIWLWGGSPAVNALFIGGAANNITHVVADSTPKNGEYSWFAIEIVATNTTNAFLGWDAFSDIPFGITHPFCTLVRKGELTAIILANESGPNGTIYVKDEGGPGHLDCSVGYGYNMAYGQKHHQISQVNYASGSEYPMIMPVYASNSVGFVGVSDRLHQAGVARGYPDTDTSKLHLYVDEVVLKDFWDGVSVVSTI